jgi:hypothetical protein
MSYIRFYLREFYNVNLLSCMSLNHLMDVNTADLLVDFNLVHCNRTTRHLALIERIVDTVKVRERQLIVLLIANTSS